MSKNAPRLAGGSAAPSPRGRLPPPTPRTSPFDASGALARGGLGSGSATWTAALGQERIMQFS
eukprot:5349627-Alexandrium_andersonii.AAC.1